MKNKIAIIGGFLLILNLPILIGFIWFDFFIMLKILLTNFLMIVFLVFIDEKILGK